MSLILSLIYTFVSGLCIPVGGLLASTSRFNHKWIGMEVRHFIIALGAGILLGAVTLVLVPEGNAALGGSVWSAVIVFFGGVTFYLLERMIGQKRRSSPQVMGMLLDFIPESIALGSLIASGSESVLLLALLIGLQNFPEGFNSYSELICANKCSPNRTIWYMFSLALLGPVAGLLGFFVFADLPLSTGALMLFASGGILYLIFQDIAPQIPLKNHWLPSVGSVLGYVIGLISLNVLEGAS
jgi:ZIP family zinc transporter